MDQAYDMELNHDRLEEMRKLFLGYMNGFKNFIDCGEIYQTQERGYKDELATIFNQEVMPLFKPFLGETSAEEGGRREGYTGILRSLGQ